MRRFPVPSSGEGNTGGKEGVIPAGDDSTIPRCGSGWCQLAFSPRFFEERFEMQPVFSSYRLSLELCSGFFFSFRSPRSVPKNGFSPAFKNRNKFLFFPFFVFFSLGSFFLARWETQGQRLSSARDQSRKIKDFLEHWLERFRVSRTARESNPIEEGKYIETRTNEWVSKRGSRIHDPSTSG